MALQGTDLFLVQDQINDKLYKVKLNDLVAEVEAGAGVVFRGSVDLNNSPGTQTPPINLPANSGDLYVVEADCASINAGWTMQDAVTSATKGDRIIYDADSTSWILITSGSSSAGTVTSVLGSLPIESNADPITPVISVIEARTEDQAQASGDGKGTSGVVARLADDGDVEAVGGSGAADAVVTADLLKATNVEIAATADSIHDGQIQIAGGDGITATGDNASANQQADTTRTLSLDTTYLDTWIDANKPYPTVGDGTIAISGVDGIIATGADATANQTGNSSKELKLDTDFVDSVIESWANVNLDEWIDDNKPYPTVGDAAINFNAGNGLDEVGDNASANQTVATTKTFTVQTDGDSIEVTVDGIKVVHIDGGEYN